MNENFIFPPYKTYLFHQGYLNGSYFTAVVLLIGDKNLPALGITHVNWVKHQKKVIPVRIKAQTDHMKRNHTQFPTASWRFRFCHKATLLPSSGCMKAKRQSLGCLLCPKSKDFWRIILPIRVKYKCVSHHIKNTRLNRCYKVKQLLIPDISNSVSESCLPSPPKQLKQYQKAKTFGSISCMIFEKIQPPHQNSL